MITRDEVKYIGYLSRTHGKQGAIQCQTESELLAEVDPDWIVLELDGILVPFRLDDWRQKNAEAFILTLHEIAEEQQAAQMCGAKVYLLLRDISEETAEEMMTMRDLIGFQVIDLHEGELGRIEDVDESTINTLFLLEGGAVIPAHDDLVADINYDTRQIFLDLPEGLLAEDQEII